MNIRERFFPLLTTLCLVVLCSGLPFLWFVVRDRQLDTALWQLPASGDALSAAGRQNAVARELYAWRQLDFSPDTVGTEMDLEEVRQDIQPYLTRLCNAGVWPDTFLAAANELLQQTTRCTTLREASGMTTYSFSTANPDRYLRLTVSDYGTLTAVHGNLGVQEGFVPSDAVKAYRTLLGLDGFADWEEATPRGYGTSAPCYSADAQLYLTASLDRWYFSMSVTSMAPETYAGL